jgi:diguanylate cyclase (GGDEF)-like protein/PAS domain S-box-containing protein
MYGYSLNEFKEQIGENVKTFSNKDNFIELLNRCISEKETIRYENENKTRDGKTIWVQTSLTPALDENGNIKELIFVETDITKLKKAYNKMKEMSLTDQLTKLKNRRYFHNLIDRDIQIAKRKLYKRTKEGLIYSMIFLMVDIDFFKKVNDTYGHSAGDQLLIQVSNRMKNTLRTSDLIVRWGGEEFLIMAKDDNFEGARLLSLRLLNAIENEKFILDGVSINITISIGFCGFPILSKKPDQFGWQDIVQLADTALYIAKENGRKQSVGIKLLDEELTEESCKIVKNDFDKALKNNIVEVISSSTIKNN